MANELRPLQCKITTGTTDNDTLPTKGYVDDQIGGGSATHENLTISTPGQTAFTLGSTPIDPAKSQLYLNGQLRIYGGGADYSISGTSLTWNDPGGLTLKTTDDFQIWYNISIGGGILSQLQIYYVGDAGDAANDGKSIEKPVLTLGQAITLVNAQSPQSDNRYEIHVIGAPSYLENITMPQFTTLDAKSAEIVGTITLSQDSIIRLNVLRIPDSVSGIVINSGIFAKIYIDLIFADDTNSIGLDLNLGSLDGYVRQFSMIGTNCKAWNLAGAAELIIACMRFNETTASTPGTGTVTSRILSKEPNFDIDFKNDTGAILLDAKTGITLNSEGPIVIDAEGTTLSLQDSTVGEMLTNSGFYPIWTNLPLVVARVSSDILAATGDATTYQIIFDSEIEDRKSNYNNATGVFTAPITGFYDIKPSIAMNGLDVFHIQLECLINATGQTRYIALNNPGAIRRSASNSLAFAGGDILKLNATDTLVISLQVSGSGKTVNVLQNSAISIKLITI